MSALRTYKRIPRLNRLVAERAAAGIEECNGGVCSGADLCVCTEARNKMCIHRIVLSDMHS